MSASGSVRVFFRKKLALDRLTISQRAMYEIGQTGVFSVADRLSKGMGPNDGPAKPLRVSYARWKSKKGKGNKRDLFFTGQLLRDLRVRTVTENRAFASVGATARQEKKSIATKDKRYTSKGKFTRALNNKDVGKINQEREPWCVFSPQNRRTVIVKVKEVLVQIKQGLVKTA
jgi:hypothetical protein